MSQSHLITPCIHFHVRFTFMNIKFLNVVIRFEICTFQQETEPARSEGNGTIHVKSHVDMCVRITREEKSVDIISISALPYTIQDPLSLNSERRLCDYNQAAQ